jgi:hypothetical protein
MHKKYILLMLSMLAIGLGAYPAAAATSSPRNTTAPSISGTMRAGETLTADAGTWSGTQPITFAYQWRRCDQNGANCSNIIGATNKTYALGSVDVGNTLRVLVKATNSSGSSAVVSASTNVVAAAPSPTVTLNVNRGLTVFGGAVLLSGTVSNANAGQTVTIDEHPFPLGTAQSHSITVTTDATGAFSIYLAPRIHTSYVASFGSVKSDPVDVLVRPKLQLRHAGRHMYSLRVSAVRSLVHRMGVVQRWNRARHVWVAIRRVRLTQWSAGTSTTVVSSTRFRLGLSGVSIRVVLPLGQASPGYVSGSSEALTA